MVSGETWTPEGHPTSTLRAQVPRHPLPSSPPSPRDSHPRRARAGSDPAPSALSTPHSLPKKAERGREGTGVLRGRGGGVPPVSPGAEALAHGSRRRGATQRRSARGGGRGCGVGAAATPTPSGLGSRRGAGGLGRWEAPLGGTRTTATSGVRSAPPHVAAAVVPPSRGCAVTRPGRADQRPRPREAAGGLGGGGGEELLRGPLGEKGPPPPLEVSGAFACSQAQRGQGQEVSRSSMRLTYVIITRNKNRSLGPREVTVFKKK